MILTGGSAKPFHGKGTFKLKQETSTGCGLQTQSWKGFWGWILSKSLNHIRDQGFWWHFNPPHPMHFWGVLEREIGTIRCLLNTMLVKLGGPQVTHKLLVTLMA